MVLSDHDIRALIENGDLVIESPDNAHMDNIYCASMDFRLGKYFKIYDHANNPVLDPYNSDSLTDVTKTLEISEPGVPFILQPGEFVLGVTMEKIKLPANVVARCEGRSSIGRLGVIIHSTAGFIDPGFEGTITLEMTNINRMPIALYPGMRIGQFAFEKLSSPADVPYNMKTSAKYMHQSLPEESRITRDHEFKK